MNESEKLKAALEEKFVYLKDAIRLQRERRLWTEVGSDLFFDVLTFAREIGFDHLTTITGLDEGESLAFIYHLSTQAGTMLNLKTRVLKDKESLPSVTALFPGAAIYERELADLFGARVDGVPPGVRYPLPDDWPAGQYPLRKDWDQKVLDQEGKKHG
jgi:Ni,Fe-hydrogenase III component G